MTEGVSASLEVGYETGGGWVVITGATGGLGEALAKAFRFRRCNMILTGRDLKKLEALKAELIAADQKPAGIVGGHTIQIECIVAELGKPESARELFDKVTALGHPIGVLVNNAGFADFGPFHEAPVEKLVEMLLVNVRAVTELTRLFLPAMVERKRGYILNVASTAAFMPGPLMAEYYATKAYVLSLNEGIREELKGTGVSVTCLCPGPTATGFQSRADMGSSKLIKSGLMEPFPVALEGVSGMFKRKAIVIPGFKNKILAFIPRLMPRSIIPGIVLKAQEESH